MKMKIENQILRSAKFLYGALSLVIFLIVFGFGSFYLQKGASAKTPMSAIVNLNVDKDSFGEKEDVILHVTLKNPNRRAASVLKWFTPFETVERSLFTVSLNGEPVSYLGRVVKRAAPTDMDYLTLMAGESVTGDIVLSDYYAFLVSGYYEVTYDVASLQLYLEGEFDQLNNGHLTSNTLKIFVEGRITP